MGTDVASVVRVKDTNVLDKIRRCIEGAKGIQDTSVSKARERSLKIP